ncbi:MAG: PilZ domain-containing protein [Porticoccus sp.]|nr:MAG: PilZ domain-containing protein [Porticoccus sp.]
MWVERERRCSTRHQLNVEVDVVDQFSRDLLGVLVDIHLEGLLLMGELSFRPDRLYQVALVPRTSDHQLDVIPMGIDCLWTRAMGQQDRVWAGCQIVDLAPQAGEQLARLIEDFSSDHSVPAVRVFW